jgi:hypothetical protein
LVSIIMTQLRRFMGHVPGPDETVEADYSEQVV